MLYVVLVLLVIAFGLLIATLVLSQTMLAWVSVGVSVLAALLLIADALRRSRARRRARQAAPPVRPSVEPEPLDVDRREEEDDLFAPAVPAGEGKHAIPEEPQDELAAADEPAIEPTAEEDLAALADLDDEVVVVDERPRYHLDSCSWLGDRPIVPLPVYEARELGFTPCAICAPDAELLAAYRT